MNRLRFHETIICIQLKTQKEAEKIFCSSKKKFQIFFLNQNFILIFQIAWNVSKNVFVPVVEKSPVQSMNYR